MSGAARTCRKFWITGQVQGVYFRASAREVARKLGVDGWIRNLPDGRVEVLARGKVDALAAFARWLAQGPEHATVSGVASETSPDDPADGFEIR